MATTPTAYTDRGKEFMQRRKLRSRVRKSTKGLKGKKLLRQLKSAKGKTEGLTGDELRKAQVKVNVLSRRRDTLRLRKEYGKDYRKKVYGSTKRPKFGQKLAKIAKDGIKPDEQEKFDKLMQQRHERSAKFAAAAKKVAGGINDKKNKNKNKGKG